MVVGRFLLPIFFYRPETFFYSPLVLECYSKDGGMLLRPCPAALFACIYSTDRPAVMRASSPINTRDFLEPFTHLNAISFCLVSDKLSSQATNESRITCYYIQ